MMGYMGQMSADTAGAAGGEPRTGLLEHCRHGAPPAPPAHASRPAEALLLQAHSRARDHALRPVSVQARR